MRNYLQKAKKLHLAQALKTFKTKVVRPDIIKYLFAQITFEDPTGQILSIDINEMSSFIEKQQEEISLVEVLDHVMINAKPCPMITNDASFYSCEYRKLDMRYFYCEIISCLQLGLQLFLTNLFLGGQFFSYGFKVSHIFLFFLMGGPTSQRDYLGRKVWVSKKREKLIFK